MRHYLLTTISTILLALTVSGCATKPAQPFDYGSFKQYQPKSILVLPPLNTSSDIKATYGFMSTVTYPLAEAGYYVFPVALVDQTFKENGLTVAGEMHQAPITKLQEIFGADSALYITVEQYGAKYVLTQSVITVVVKASLVDLKSGTSLWKSEARASSNEQQQQNQGGLIGALITGLIQQVTNSLSDSRQLQIAHMASSRLLSPRPNGGILYGPRSPQFGKDTP